VNAIKDVCDIRARGRELVEILNSRMLPRCSEALPAAQGAELSVIREPVSNSYYNNAAKEFLIPNRCGGWTRANSFEARAFLQQDDIREVMLSRPVSYAGPLAGYQAGFMRDKSILVTSSPPKVIKPKQGSWDKIRTLAASLFVRMTGRKAYSPEDIDLTAFNHLLAWLLFGYEHTSGGIYTPGQLLVMAGPAGCGKSAFQDRVITQLFGGRSADPFAYLSGQDNFNAQLFGAEHLMMADKTSFAHYAGRRTFGEKIKDFVANRAQSCRAMYSVAQNLEPRWRMSLSTNLEEENLKVLPILEGSLEDKMMILKVVEEVPSPFRGFCSPEEANAYGEAMEEELPALLHYLQEEAYLQEQMRDSRYGVKAYHDPEIMAALRSASPEAEVLDLILDTISNPKIAGESAHQIYSKLTNSELNSDWRTAQRMLNGPRALAQHLGKLQKAFPDLVYFHRHNTGRAWHLDLEALRRVTA
jgi:hypothetical protein